MKIILGSSSTIRAQILSHGLNTPVHVARPDIDEKAIRRPNVEHMVRDIAHAKADALLERYHDQYRQQQAVLITADQVVLCDDKVLEKPADADEARAYIAMYAACPPTTVGSCVLTDTVTMQRFEAIDRATVYFSPIPDETVTALIDQGDVFYCAGALMVEHKLVQPHITRMDGSLDTVQGLSMDTVKRLLDELTRARAAKSPPP